MHTLKKRFPLAAELSYFDSSGFGAVHEDVLANQADIRRKIEANPSRFLRYELRDRLAEELRPLAKFVGAAPAELCFVANASIGMNTILWNLKVAPNEGLLILDLAYRGLANLVGDYATKWKASVQRVQVDLPYRGPERLLARIERALSSSVVRYAFIEHVTSPSALVLPIAEIVALLRRRGVTTIVDGAGAPGLVPIDLGAIQSDFYVGNCHKWLGAPRPSAFLYIASGSLDRMRGMVRTSVSIEQASSRAAVQRETEWPGTYDPSAFLSVSKAIDTMSQLFAGGWPELRERNHAGLVAGLDYLRRELGAETIASPEYLASAAAFLLPGLVGQRARQFQDHLYTHGVAAVCFELGGQVAVRIGHNVFTEVSDYEALAATIRSFA